MDFKAYLENENLSDKTITNHLRNIEKSIHFFGHDFPSQYSDEDLVNDIKHNELNLSQSLTLSNTLSKYYKYLELPNDHLVNYIAFINNELKKKYINRNKELVYPYTKKDLISQMNNFYENDKWKKYIISYLLINLNVRNEDLNIEVVRHKKFISKTKNVLIIRRSDILYIRYNYKTKDRYGTKENQIKSKKFYISVLNFFQQRQYDDRCPADLFYKFYNSTNQIKKHTPYQLKESDIIKIILNESSSSLHKASKISIRRGTDLKTLESNYNINKK